MIKKRKIICSILIINILLSVIMPILSNANQVIDNGVVFTLTSSDTQIIEGSQITVNMSLEMEEGKAIDVFSGFLIYDSEILEFNTEEEFTASNETKWNSPEYVDDNEGTIQIETTRSNSNSQKSGLMYTMVFNVLKTVNSTEIKLEEINCAFLGEDIYCADYTLNIPDIPNSNSITYNKNTTDSVSNMPSNETKQEGNSYTISSTIPTREGYTFVSWNTSNDGSGTTYNPGDTYNIDADLELYAQWKAAEVTLTVDPNGGTWGQSSSKQTFTQAYGSTKDIPDPTKAPAGYTVRFNPNGGTTDNVSIIQEKQFDSWELTGGGALNGTTYTFSNTSGILKANYTGQSIILPNANKDGDTFKGWYTSLTGGNRVGGAGEEYTPEASATLFAQWEDINYTLTINPNGGTYNGETTVTGNYEDTIAVTDPIAPSGYTVTLNKNDGTESVTEITQTKNFDKWVLTGKGSFSDITYTFGLGNGTLTAKYTSNSVELETLTRVGYTFDGWYTLANGGTKVESPYIPTSNVTLYAHWTANKYEITFVPGTNATVDPTTKEVEYGKTYGTLPTPTRPGYTFDGWYNPSGVKVQETDTVDITSNTTLTALWLGTEYTVTLDPNGGTVNPTNIKVRNEAKYGTIESLPTPTRTGYNFEGWYNSNQDKIENSTTVSLVEDETLEAKWTIKQSTLTVNPNGGEWNGNSNSQNIKENYATTKQIENPISPNGYTVTFNGNGGNADKTTETQTTTFKGWTKTGGGNWNPDTTIFTYDENDATLNAEYNRNSITLPNANKLGTTFKGWYTLANGGTKIGEAGEEYTPTEDITLYAQWEEENYTLTINPNGGIYSGDTTITGNYDEEVTIENPTAPSGYTVTLNNNDGTGTTSTIMQTTSFDKWEVTGKGTIDGKTYKFADGDGTITAKYNSENVELQTLTRTGYTFDGWYTLANEGTKIESPYMPVQDITLYAHWTANTYEITFNPGENATVNPETKQVKYGETYGSMPTPVRPGYTFEGWYNSNGDKIQENDIVNITENITVTALWLGTKYTVTLNPNGGTVKKTSIQVRNEAKYGTIESLPTPTRTGYNFDGWYNSKQDKIENNTTVNLIEDETLTAKWIIKQSTLTVNPNGGEWNGNSNSQNITEDYATTKQIENPTSPNGYTVTYNTNGGTADKTSEIQKTTFVKWTKTGGGNWNQETSTFTYDENDAILEAEYNGNSIRLPGASKIGRTFEGWYTQENGGTRIGGAGDTYTPTENITLFAQWNDIEYTLTVNPNGGTYTGNTSINGTYGEEVTIQNPIAPNGYEITLNKNDGTETISTITQTASFVNWEITGKGTINGPTYRFEDGNGTLTATYTYNSVEPEIPTREGYTFDGWYTNATAGTKIEIPYNPESNITLYAHWNANKYEVTFEPGVNAIVNTKIKEVVYGQKYGTLPQPTREGYVFDGWYDVNGTRINETDIVNITENTTLTARWLGKEYTVTFDGNGVEVIPSSKKVKNEGIYGELPQPTREGYTFNGWENAYGNKIESSTNVNLTSDEILTAKWKANKYIITFNPGEGATVEEITREVEFDEKIKDLPQPTKKGYIFEGWYTQNGEKIETNDIYKNLSNIELEAKWLGEKHTITFDYQGGTGNTQDKEIQNGQAYGELPTATREGYTFISWIDGNGNEITSQTIADTENDMTIYAKYKINVYNVTFKNDDGSILAISTVNHGESVAYIGETPIKSNATDGYVVTFVGWDNQEKLNNVTEDREVMAVYDIKPITYIIKYYNLKNIENSQNPTTYTIETPNINLVDLPNKGKYVFKGWYTSNRKDAEKVTSIDTSKLGNIILYAQWENDELYYATEKYKVGENNIDIYEQGDIYLNKIEPNTTAKTVIESSDTNGIIEIIDLDGNILEDNDIVGTGMTIKILREDEQIIMTTVVMGDLNGDGIVTATDLSAINQAVLKTTTLDEPGYKAADLDDNNKITATDLSTINNTILKKIILTYDKKML